MYQYDFRWMIFMTTFFSTASYAAGMPDTGQALCDDGNYHMIDCSTINSGDAATMPRQDGRFGRDPATVAGQVSKQGGGMEGFDYTTVSPLECAQDNITGLMWEVKVNDLSQLRHYAWSYAWFSDATRGDGTANEMNGGAAGTENGGFCFNQYDAVTNASGNFCDTAGYVAAVNAASLCGFTDWRMPSRRELKTITHLGTKNPAIDTSYFPNTGASHYWTATSSAITTAMGLTVDFYTGIEVKYFKSAPYLVRLVRGGTF